MKTIKIYTLLSALLTISLFSCDIVEEPFMEEIVVDACEDKCRKVLLEDYTGHKCGNCPRAAEKAEELKEIYGDQLVSIAIHAGYFAGTSGSHFTTDFTTPAGDEWDTHFGNSLAGNPNGMINRQGYPESEHILQYSEWAQIIDEVLESEPEIYIDITTSYNVETHSLDVTTKTEILQNIDAALSLNVVLTESGIIAYQTDYAADPQEIADYEHNHVMRKSLTGAWGIDLGLNTYNAGDIINNSFSVELEDNWNHEHMTAVAFVANTNTFEVYQAEETYIVD